MAILKAILNGQSANPEERFDFVCGKIDMAPGPTFTLR